MICPILGGSELVAMGAVRPGFAPVGHPADEDVGHAYAYYVPLLVLVGFGHPVIGTGPHTIVAPGSYPDPWLQ